MFIKGAQIGPSLKNLAERRTDIFGSEETVIGRKVHIYILLLCAHRYVCQKHRHLFRTGVLQHYKA